MNVYQANATTSAVDLNHNKPFNFSHAMLWLFDEYDYGIAYGGRGSAKSWSIAQYLIIRAYTGKELILCVREFQTSIADSVHKLISNQIDLMGLSPWFDILKTSIRCKITGSEFLFKGISLNSKEIKSMEGVTITWAEEAQGVSKDAWEIILPTVFRTKGARLVLSMNPENEKDATYQEFIANPKPNSIIRKINYTENPWFPIGLEKQRAHMLETDPDAYSWIWLGNCKAVSDAVIFKGKYSVEAFEAPEQTRFYHGADWGFSQDPCALIRCWIKDECLYIDRECYGIGVELTDLPAFFEEIETARSWPIKADNSRPETISFMKGQGFGISGAKKWDGSVEDGVTHLKGFKRIIIHPQCKNVISEFALYSYKVDKNTGDVLPIIVDKHNHCMDALRYALDGFIKRRGKGAMWAALAK